MCKAKKTVRKAAVLFSAAAVMASSFALLNREAPDMTALALETGQVANPIIYSDVPDPDIIRVGDTYYMVSTTMFYNPGVPVMKSKDMASWEICNYVYDIYHDGDNQNLKNGKHDYAHGQWATSLRYHKGTYYVFFGSYGSGKSYIYKTNDIENGTWTRSEINGMYHDASMLFDDDGRNYLVYGGGGEIKIKELNSQMTGFANGAQERTLFKTGLSGLAGEGSHIQKINGWYYVFIIAWPNGSGRIELCYRSKSLTGNFESKTILNSGVGTYGAGAAQGGIVDTPDGKWYGLVFQDHGGIGRIPALVPVTWQNDWPVMGVNGKVPVVMELPGDHTGTQLAKSDDFSYDSNKLKLEWQWNHNPDNSSWSVTDRPGWLRLKNGTVAKSIVHARNTLTMRTEGPSCQGVIRMDVSNMKPGDHAGLSAFQYNYGNVGVRVTDSGEKKIYMASNAGYNGNADVLGSYDKIEEEVSLTGDIVYVKTDFKFANVDSNYNISNNIDKVNFYYSLDGSNWKKIGKEISMGFDLKFFTGYRNAIYSYGTKTTGGYVDIDSFDYTRAEWNPAQAVVPAEPDADGYWFHDTFEDTTSAWSGRGSAKTGPSGRAPHKGTEALVISEREAAWNGAQRTLSTSVFKPGEEYAFSACFNSLEGGDQVEYKLTLQYDAGGETHYDKIAQAYGNQGEYVQLYNPSYQIPEGASNLILIAETTEDLCNFYIDEVIAAPGGTKIDGPVSNVVPATDIKGDLDFDSRITIADLVVMKHGIISGFRNNAEKKNADVDQSTVTDAADAVNLQKYLIGAITEFPDNKPAEPEKPAFDYNPAVSYREAPGSYLNPCSQSGKIVKETYNGINGSNSLNVYLPYGYDSSKKYNIFYLMHGGSENENTIFSNDVKFNYILDNMIMNGELEPMIVVTPTFNKCQAETVWREIKESIVPFVEGKYSTYAENTSAAALEASRMHRAYGGFSMGGGSTWNVLINDINYFAYYMPLSGHCWGGANAVANAVGGSKYKDSTYIFAATGTEDIAYPNLKPQIDSMKNNAVFKYTSDFSKGNLYFLEAPGKTHWWGFVRHYVYDGLPYFFHE